VRKLVAQKPDDSKATWRGTGGSTPDCGEARRYSMRRRHQPAGSRLA